MVNILKWYATALLFCSILGCNTASPTQPVETAAKSQENAPITATTEAKAQSSSVAKIVFVGQKEACPCTKARIAKTLPNLEKAVTRFKDISIRKIQNDVEVDESDRYDEMRSVMVIPGIYFLDKSDKLVDMLQGEVTEEQIVAVLQK